MALIERLTAAQLQLRSPPCSHRSRRMKLQLHAPSLGVPYHRPKWCAQLAPNQPPSPISAQNLAPTTGKLQPNPFCFRFSSTPVSVPEAFPPKPTPLNMH